jgi:hypothetical protein
MLHGLELAHTIIARLAAAKVADRALVLQMPGWSSRTPTVPFAVAVTRGPLFHILGAVEVWKVIVAPPPALARFAKPIEWNNQGADEAVVGDALVALAHAWWREAPEAVGAFDVAGSITHALTDALGDAHGTFGNTTYTQYARGVAEGLAGCGIGRNGDQPRWPELANVEAQPHAIAVTLTQPDGTRETSELSTVHDLAAALPDIVTRLRATDDACAAWLASLAALRGSAERLCTGLPGTWTITPPFEIEVTNPPRVVMRAPAEVGGEMDIHVVARGAGESASVAVGHQTFDLSEDTYAAIAVAIAIESRVVRAGRLVEGASYRVTRPFCGASPGDVLVFREVAEVRPSGADMWYFSTEGRHATAVSLRSDVAEDCAVLDTLADYLTRLPSASG